MNPRHPPTECCAYAQAAADHKRINADHTSLGSFERHIRLRRERASQSARDSLLEGNGFELPVPRAMQGRPKAIIAGFGCKPPSLDYLRLPSAEITEGGPKRNLGTEALSRAEPEVRIHFPPAKSPRTFGP
jgi:hypothetical protein